MICVTGHQILFCVLRHKTYLGFKITQLRKVVSHINSNDTMTQNH